MTKLSGFFTVRTSIQFLLLFWIFTSVLMSLRTFSTINCASSSGGPQHPNQTIKKGNKNKDIMIRDIQRRFEFFGMEDEQRQPDATTSKDPKSCECVNCEEDSFCGRLWQGNQPFGSGDDDDRKTSIEQIPIHAVVSYCKGDLGFVEAMTEGYNVKSIHIISKCGYPVFGAPQSAVVEVLPNVGRCDHTYAHYITTVLDVKLALARNDSSSSDDDAVVVFLKDNAGSRNLHQSGRWNSFSDMVEVAASKAGFSCGIVPEMLNRGKRFTEQYELSAHFELKSLREFQITEYGSRSQYESDNISFESNHSTLGRFYDHLGADSLEDRDLVQVCFGGVFAASMKQIKKQKMDVWKSVEENLSRGDNIQEGHYVERLWGMLLAAPLEEYQVKAIRHYSDTVFRPGEHDIIVNLGKASVIGILGKEISVSSE